jgi:hypothetical protein
MKQYNYIKQQMNTVIAIIKQEISGRPILNEYNSELMQIRKKSKETKPEPKKRNY